MGKRCLHYITSHHITSLFLPLTWLKVQYFGIQINGGKGPGGDNHRLESLQDGFDCDRSVQTTQLQQAGKGNEREGLIRGMVRWDV